MVCIAPTITFNIALSWLECLSPPPVLALDGTRLTASADPSGKPT